MAVEVRYLVIRDGKEVGMYTTKKEADAHDKMLDIAENLFLFIKKLEHMEIKEELIEELSIQLSQNREQVMRILKGAAPGKALREASAEESAPKEPAAGEKRTPKPARATAKMARAGRS
jgi:dsDNA-binding SOS-regulon protein